MSRRAGLLLLGVLVLAFGAGLGLTVALRGPGCPVELAELDNGTPELVAATELAPEGTVGEERRPEIDAMEALGDPFGDVVSGRFYAAGTPAPVLVPFGDDVVLASPGQDSGAFRAVDVPEGTVRWGRGYDGGAARGGLLGDDFVVLVGGPEPSVVSLDPEDGDQRSCVATPVGDASGAATTLLTDQAGADVAVVAGPPAAAVTLSRIAPVGEEVRWVEQLDGIVEAGSVTVVGGTVVVSRIAQDPVRLADMAAAGGIAAPMVTAYSLEDGRDLWSYPAADEAATTSALVVGSDPASGNLMVLTAEPGRSGSSKATRARLVALGPDGAETWSTRLGSGYWSASLWGDLVVAQGAAPRGGARLRAFDGTNGESLWSLDSATLPSLGEQPRTNFGSAVAVGEELLVPAPNGLVAVDPATGVVERLDSTVAVEQVFPAGDHLLVRTHDALFVLEAVGVVGGGV
jgi:outer membrane protein assembly factor BamB